MRTGQLNHLLVFFTSRKGNYFKSPFNKALKKYLSWPHKPGFVLPYESDNHSSRPAIAHRLKQSTRSQREPRHTGSYLILLRVEFTLQPTVTSGPVRSYRTLSPLPNSRVWRSSLCCTCRRLTPPRRYLAPCSAEPGLSSPSFIKTMQRLSRPTQGGDYT